jgi:hypothetical protein
MNFNLSYQFKKLRTFEKNYDIEALASSTLN